MVACVDGGWDLIGADRGVAVGFWFNIGMDSSAACHIGEDGTVTLISGSPDIGGSRASLALMAAEELGIDYHKIRPIVADTASIGALTYEPTTVGTTDCRAAGDCG